MKNFILLYLMLFITPVSINIEDSFMWGIEILPTSGPSYQILDININIFYIDKGEKKICEYRIDKYNNLIAININEKKTDIYQVDKEVYSLNLLLLKNINTSFYKQWEDKNIELTNEGLYIEESLNFLDEEPENIYVIEYYSKGIYKKLPLILRENKYKAIGVDRKIKVNEKDVVTYKKIIAKEYKELGELILKLNGYNNCLF